MPFKTKTIVLIILAIIAIFIFLLYYVLKNTTKDVSDKEPYAEIMNKQIVTIDDAVYIENTTHLDIKEYPNELQDHQNIDLSRVKHTVVPKGSIVEFNKAISIKGGTSGFTNSYLLGTLTLKETNKKIPIVYSWGFLKTFCLEEPCNYWEFKKAPWQTEIDTKKYFD